MLGYEGVLRVAAVERPPHVSHERRDRLVRSATAGWSPYTDSTTPTSSIPRIRGKVTASPE